MIAGPSGIGKTTIAKAIAKEYDWPYVNGSYRAFISEEWKKLHHSEMLQENPNEIKLNDYQTLNARAQCFRGLSDYVTDRSYLDSAAYWLHKLAHQVPNCETQDFIGLCCTMLLKQGPDLLIYLPFTEEHLKSWKVEDDNKRITSGWFQYGISANFDAIIRYLGWNFGTNRSPYMDLGINTPECSPLPFLVIQEFDHNQRMEKIRQAIRSLENDRAELIEKVSQHV